MRPRIAPSRRFTASVGVIDIGSNSIRLVVFAGAGRTPDPIFNEKVLCGLGRGLERTGRLNQDGARSALANLERFAALVRLMKVRRLRVVGTAAVRDAADGPEFIAAVRRRTGLRVEILPGGEEARLSALGVLSGMPEADGVMGDLGGGSLELVALPKGRLGGHVTLPFGPLRLREVAERGRNAMPDLIDQQLQELSWLRKAKGHDFYAVGGAWRAIARLHMAHVNYPLRVIHHYTLSRSRAEDFLDLIAGLSRESLERIGRVPRKRLEVLPLAALVLYRVLLHAKPSRLVFTAMGLREGCLYDALPAAVRRRDPLLDACETVAVTHGRFPLEGRTLHKWLAPLFPKSTPLQDRLHLAACYLGDIAWHEHPDYRAEIAFDRVLHMPTVAIDHPSRAFLALAVHTRYGGSVDGPLLGPAFQLLNEEQTREAYRLGLALRLAFTISGGAPQALARARLKRDGDTLRLRLAGGTKHLIGEAVERRLEALADAFDRKPKIKLG